MGIRHRIYQSVTARGVPSVRSLPPLEPDLHETASHQGRPPLPAFRGISHEFAAHSNKTVQAKMVVRPAADPYEQQADRVAAEVVQQIGSPSESISIDPDHTLQKQTTDNQVASTLPFIPGHGGIPISNELAANIQQADTSGHPLPTSIREPMEQAMGTDFSNVKIHTDSRADSLNRSIAAQAFTTGHSIFFRHGHYQPESRHGQTLIAHELTHVVQQGQTSSQIIPGGTIQRTPFDAYEIYLALKDFELMRQWKSVEEKLNLKGYGSIGVVGKVSGTKGVSYWWGKFESDLAQNDVPAMPESIRKIRKRMAEKQVDATAKGAAGQQVAPTTYWSVMSGYMSKLATWIQDPDKVAQMQPWPQMTDAELAQLRESSPYHSGI